MDPKGDVYGKIVNDVIESSRTAFEEDGIDMSALDLLQSVGSSLSFSPQRQQVPSYSHYWNSRSIKRWMKE